MQHGANVPSDPSSLKIYIEGLVEGFFLRCFGFFSRPDNAPIHCWNNHDKPTLLDIPCVPLGLESNFNAVISWTFEGVMLESVPKQNIQAVISKLCAMGHGFRSFSSVQIPTPQQSCSCDKTVHCSCFPLQGFELLLLYCRMPGPVFGLCT